jgi:hypothetical protein
MERYHGWYTKRYLSGLNIPYHYYGGLLYGIDYPLSTGAEQPIHILVQGQESDASWVYLLRQLLSNATCLNSFPLLYAFDLGYFGGDGTFLLFLGPRTREKI